MRNVKEWVLTVIGIGGSLITHFFGGADTMFIVLCVFLALDYITGVIVASVFKKSAKTENGKLSSTVSIRGLIKKIYMVCFVGIANMLDIALGTSFIRGGVIVAFICNETISLIENAGLMGVPIPSVLHKAIEILSDMEEKSDE